MLDSPKSEKIEHHPSRESNHRPPHIECVALPSELPGFVLSTVKHGRHFTLGSAVVCTSLIHTDQETPSPKSRSYGFLDTQQQAGTYEQRIEMRKMEERKY